MIDCVWCCHVQEQALDCVSGVGLVCNKPTIDCVSDVALLMNSPRLTVCLMFTSPGSSPCLSCCHGDRLRNVFEVWIKTSH